ncbi:fatty acid desaturase [Burkholderia ubonensis]|uniref:fatty acid desaturase n=1 Tax=Burkholderia ubonensis TaxID=101571 RepID=UPI0020C87136|nr:fatty acid desaturase [Burkholderia ubonensis]
MSSHRCAHLPSWLRWVILNFNLHIVHHAYPWLPWHELPARNGSSMRCNPPARGTKQTNGRSRRPSDAGRCSS